MKKEKIDDLKPVSNWTLQSSPVNRECAQDI